MSTFSSLAPPGSRELIVGNRTSGRPLHQREAARLNANHARGRVMLSPRLDAERSLAAAQGPQKLAVKRISAPAGPPAVASAKRFISRHISMKGSS